MLTKEDKILIKKWETKKYGVRRLIKEFPNKKWSKRGMEDFLWRLRTMRFIERAPGSGRPSTTCTAENIDAVEDLVLSHEDQPQTHRSTWQISRELGISQTTVRRVIYAMTYHLSVWSEEGHSTLQLWTKLLAFSVLGSCCSGSLTLMWISFYSPMRKFVLFVTVKCTEWQTVCGPSHVKKKCLGGTTVAYSCNATFCQSLMGVFRNIQTGVHWTDICWTRS